MNDTEDREQIILHRLFETRQEDVDEKAVRDIVSEFVDHYTFPIEIDEPKRYENRMVETYLFHPEFLDLLDDIYEAGRERQSVRGLDDFLRGADEPLDACDYAHGILRDHVNFLLTENPRVQFVIKDVEYWDEPVLRDGDDEISLKRIFHGIEQEGSRHYFSNINVKS